MNWIQSSEASLLALTPGTVCWVYSRFTKRCVAAVWRPADGAKWRYHEQEHFAVPGVSKFIVLPTK